MWCSICRMVRVLRLRRWRRAAVNMNPLSDDDLREKYWRLAEPVLGTSRTQQIETCVARLVESAGALAELRELVLSPVEQ